MSFENKVIYPSMKYSISGLLLLSILFVSCNNEESGEIATDTQPSISAPANIAYSVLNAYPHDTAAFTQGLEVYNGQLIESTGLYGKSSLRNVSLKTGKSTKQINNEKEIFAEGITILRDTIYQLSWENHLVFLYDAKTFKQIGTRNWNYQGWGITNDGSSLIISDGTDKLYYTEPNSLKIKNIISVKDHLGAVNNLNELGSV